MRGVIGIMGGLLIAMTAWADPGTAIISGPAADWAARPVRVELTSKGYRVILSRPAVEQFQATLERLGDGKDLSKFIGEMSKIEALDEESTLRLQLMSWAVANQFPAFKQAMQKNPGPNGAIINVFGIQREAKKERPIIRAIAKGVVQRLPNDLEEKARNALAIARTDVLFWTVEPRP